MIYRLSTYRLFLLSIMLGAMLAACEYQPPMTALGIDGNYSVYRMVPLILRPEYPGEAYLWTMTDSNGNDSIISTSRNLYFVKETPGDYRVKLNIVDPHDPVEHIIDIKVWEEDVAYTPYIHKVWEYLPAPGQFVNKLPPYEPGDTQADMNRKAEECISGRNDVMISLGSYGGYVIFSFDHTVMNRPGSYDLKIYGNSFYSTDPSDERQGGSAEPGIVMVSQDLNGNGLPDDPWYELAGSEYHSPATLHNYTITYTRPSAGHVAVPVPGTAVTDACYIHFSGSDGSYGYVERNSYHDQDYYPLWIDINTLSFSGTRLPQNAIDLSGIGQYYVLYAYDWGYVDNHPNDVGDLSSFKIDWAVDDAGNPVHLDGIDFVKVYTGVSQQCGWLGETSTEICRAEDLHIINQ